MSANKTHVSFFIYLPLGFHLGKKKKTQRQQLKSLMATCQRPAELLTIVCLAEGLDRLALHSQMEKIISCFKSNRLKLHVYHSAFWLLKGKANGSLSTWPLQARPVISDGEDKPSTLWEVHPFFFLCGNRSWKCWLQMNPNTRVLFRNSSKIILPEEPVGRWLHGGWKKDGCGFSRGTLVGDYSFVITEKGARTWLPRQQQPGLLSQSRAYLCYGGIWAKFCPSIWTLQKKSTPIRWVISHH